MPKETVEIPVSVLSSVETLDELEDWLIAQNAKIVAELREARRKDLAGEFKFGNRAIPVAYRIEIGPKASAQLSELDPTVGAAVERKIIWLAENAPVMIHRPTLVCRMIWQVCANYE